MKNPFPQFGSGKGMKKTNSHYSGMGRELKKTFPKFGNRKGMKKSIPIIREASEAFILGNGGEREFPLTPGKFINFISKCMLKVHNFVVDYSIIYVVT